MFQVFQVFQTISWFEIRFWYPVLISDKVTWPIGQISWQGETEQPWLA